MGIRLAELSAVSYQRGCDSCRRAAMDKKPLTAKIAKACEAQRKAKARAHAHASESKGWPIINCCLRCYLPKYFALRSA